MSKPAVLIYTRDLCGYCAAAKALLDRKGVDYAEINATGDAARRQEMTTRTGGTTFPQILIGGQPVGGCDDLHALERSGKLDELLAG